MEPSEAFPVPVQLYCKYFFVAQVLLQMTRLSDDLVTSCMAPGAELGLQQQRLQLLTDIEDFESSLRRAFDSTIQLLETLVPQEEQPDDAAGAMPQQFEQGAKRRHRE